MLLRHNTTQCVTTTAVLEIIEETDCTVDKEVSIGLDITKWGWLGWIHRLVDFIDLDARKFEFLSLIIIKN